MKPSNSKGEIDQEYQNLKHKVESEIQALQKKLSQNTEIHYHRTINGGNRTVLEPSTQSEYQNCRKQEMRQQHHHHHNHHHNHSTHHNHSVCSMKSCCHSHQNCCSVERSCNCKSRKSSLSIEETQPIPSVSKVIHSSTTSLLQAPSHPPVNIPLVNTKILEHNLFLQQAFIKSMYTQQEMAQNLRLLEQKISKLENNSNIVKPSNESEKQYQWRVLSEGQENQQNGDARGRSLKNAKLMRDGEGFEKFVTNEYSTRKHQSGGEDVQRSKSRSLNKIRSLNKSKSTKSNNKLSKKLINQTKNVKPTSQKSITSSSQSNQYLLLYPTTRIKSPKSNYNTTNNKSLPKNHLHSDYYTVDKLCPVHINPMEIRLKSKDKEVYHDSEHRNRKHERNHLVESFKQQDIARKKLMEKILKGSTGVNIKLIK